MSSFSQLDSDVLSHILSFGLLSAPDVQSLKFTCRSLYQFLSGGSFSSPLRSQEISSLPPIHISDSLRNQLESLYLPRVVIQMGLNVDFEDTEQGEPYQHVIDAMKKIFQNKCRKISSQEVEIEIQWPKCKEYTKSEKESDKNGGNANQDEVEYSTLWKYIDSAHVNSDKNGNREILTEFLHARYFSKKSAAKNDIEASNLNPLDDSENGIASVEKQSTQHFLSLHEETQLRKYEKDDLTNSTPPQEDPYISIQEFLYSWKNKHFEHGKNLYISQLIDSDLNLNACQLFDKFILHLHFVPCMNDRDPSYSTQQLEDSISATLTHPKRKIRHKLRNFIKPYGTIYDGRGIEKYQFLPVGDWTHAHAELKTSVFVKIIFYYLFKDYLIGKIEKQCSMNLKAIYDTESVRYLKKIIEEERYQIRNGCSNTMKSETKHSPLRSFLLIENNVIKAYQNSVLNLYNPSSGSCGRVGRTTLLSVIPSSKFPSCYVPVLSIQEHLALMSLESMNDKMRRIFVSLYLESIYASEMQISDSMRKHYEEKMGVKSKEGISFTTSSQSPPSESTNNTNALNLLSFTFETLEFDRTISKMKHNIVEFPKYPSISLSKISHTRPSPLRLFQETSIIGQIDRFILENICPVKVLCCCNVSVITCCCLTTAWCGCYRGIICPLFLQWLGVPKWLGNLFCDSHRFLPSLDCELCCNVMCCKSPEEYDSFKVYKNATVNDTF
ncbi:hypothetical protein FDP41_012987 [Naegleria fowleri]|uniref:F-box domain-containing protein n=1 Tax=Naegleria fowleri TaxID=5763 RepID=A0A6A5C7D5_NAEFO|nr:uncharacterized protein FDP41_012987 [Naegleria fowleri]KAF0981199.1 hypothetical protein FDP41_012987 [Naegleria fowleri]